MDTRGPRDSCHESPLHSAELSSVKPGESPIDSTYHILHWPCDFQGVILFIVVFVEVFLPLVYVFHGLPLRLGFWSIFTILWCRSWEPPSSLAPLCIFNSLRFPSFFFCFLQTGMVLGAGVCSTFVLLAIGLGGSC
jgi:hypothetical protein